MTQDAAQRLSVSCGAHGRKRYRLSLVFHCVELALLKMV